MQASTKLRFFYLSFVAVFLCASLKAAPALKVDDTSKSLFFGTGEPDPKFNYKEWAGDADIYAAPFDAAKWEDVAPLPKVPTSGDPVVISREHAENLLLRFQKPGGFSKENQNILEGIFTSRIVQDSPFVVAGALQNVVATDPATYDALIAEFPSLKTMRFEKIIKNPFRTKEEDKAVTDAAFAYFDSQEDRLIVDSEAGTEVKDWLNLTPLAPVLHNEKSQDRDAHEDEVMENIFAKALDHEFKSSAPSYLFPVVEPAIEQLFGDTPEIVTMLEITREGDTFTPLIHGTAPIEGLAETRNPYGFFSTEFSKFTLSEVSGQEPRHILWEMAGHRFEAEVNVDKTEEGEILIPQGAAPRYDEMVQDGTVYGLILFGTNIKKDLKSNVKEYTDYFEEHGFEQQNEKTLSNFKPWLKKQIESGETVFLDKEAHASSDVDNFLEIDEKDVLLTFTRKAGSHLPEQVIRIAYPAPDSPDSDSISNQELGEWMRKRETDNKTPFLLANMSCWSVDQAVLQVPEIHSSIFSEIVSTSVTDEFADIEDSGVKILIESFLNQASYADMREQMRKDSGFRKGSSDAFVFPDEARYNQLLFKGGTPVRIRWQIKDIDSGKIYDGDDLGVF